MAHCAPGPPMATSLADKDITEISGCAKYVMKLSVHDYTVVQGGLVRSKHSFKQYDFLVDSSSYLRQDTWILHTHFSSCTTRAFSGDFWAMIRGSTTSEFPNTPQELLFDIYRPNQAPRTRAFRITLAPCFD